MSDIEHVGYDRDGDKVWKVGPDEFIGGPETEAEARKAMAQPKWGAYSRRDYQRNFGWIRKRKP